MFLSKILIIHFFTKKSAKSILPVNQSLWNLICIQLSVSCNCSKKFMRLLHQEDGKHGIQSCLVGIFLHFFSNDCWHSFLSKFLRYKYQSLSNYCMLCLSKSVDIPHGINKKKYIIQFNITKVHFQKTRPDTRLPD